jgi:membrane protein implicated in regulation of membrane protease activity
VVRDEYLPPGFLAPWFGLAAAFTLVRLVLPTTPARVAKFSEVAELTVALAAAITSIKLARTASADRSTVSPPFQDQAPHAQ